jgi:hypothetical protein
MRQQQSRQDNDERCTRDGKRHMLTKNRSIFIDRLAFTVGGLHEAYLHEE